MKVRRKKRQVSNEDAVRLVAYWMRKYDDCNPDVGMSWRDFTAEATKALGLRPSDVPSLFPKPKPAPTTTAVSARYVDALDYDDQSYLDDDRPF